MSAFPLNPTIGDEYNGYSWDGTSWNLIGNKFNPSSFSATAPDNPKPGDLWIDSSTDVGAVSPESLLTKAEAQSTYYTKAVSDEKYVTNFTLSSYATKDYADNAATNAVNSLIDTAPANLDTLNELAAALNDDANFASTVTTSLSNKQDKVAGVSDIEIGYLDGVTSSIQTQINTKAPSLNPIFTGTVTLPSGTSIGNVSSTELGYLDGITSGVQSQLDGKAVQGSNGLPWRMAAGYATGLNSNTYTYITYPSGRFTSAPAFVATGSNLSIAGFMYTTGNSATSIGVAFNASTAGNPCYWIAVQMLSNSGAG